MKIEKSNPPINGYEKETKNSATIADGRIEKLESTLAECIHTSSKTYSNYNFYWYEEKDYQRYCREKKLPNCSPIMKGMSELKTNILLGRVFDNDVYINLDAFPMNMLSDIIEKEMAKISLGHGGSNENEEIYKEYCKEILEQI